MSRSLAPGHMPVVRQPDDELNPPQKVLRKRLGPAGRAAAERQREQEELRELRSAKEAADAARAEAEAERLRLDARLQEQEAAMWAAKLAEQKAIARAHELEADLQSHAESAAEVRSHAAELDEQLAAARAATEAANRKHAAALRAQLAKVEKELRDNALHTGRPSTQARWAIGVVQSLVPNRLQPDVQLSQQTQPAKALAHQPVTLARPVKPAVGHVDKEQRNADKRPQPQPQPQPQPHQHRTKILNPAQQQAVRDKYSGTGAEEQAAAFLQSVVRGARVRREAKQRDRCAQMLQAMARGWKGRKAAERERLSVAAQRKAEQELFERMQELKQRSGLQADWRNAGRPKAALALEPEPELEPDSVPGLEPQPQPELELNSGGQKVHESRRRRSHRSQARSPPLATTFAGLQPRWRPSMSASHSIPTVRSSLRGHRRPATTDGSKWWGRDEVFPDVRYPGGQPHRLTAESEVERAKREWQQLQDTAAAFGFAGATCARRAERQQLRNVPRWDGSALPRKGVHDAPISPSLDYSQEADLNQQQHSFGEDEFSDPSALLDEKFAAESAAAMVALSEARANYEKASGELRDGFTSKPHTYVVEYPDGSLDMFGGGGVAVGPNEGTRAYLICVDDRPSLF